MGVARAFLRSGHLKRDIDAQLPKGVRGSKVAWELLRPLYGLGAACKDWYKTITNFLSGKCGCKAASSGKSAFLWSQQVPNYEYLGISG